MAAVDMLVADGGGDRVGRHGPAGPLKPRLTSPWPPGGFVAAGGFLAGPTPRERRILYRRPPPAAAIDGQHASHRIKGKGPSGPTAPATAWANWLQVGCCRHTHIDCRVHRARHAATWESAPGPGNTSTPQQVAIPSRDRDDFCSLQTASATLSSNAGADVSQQFGCVEWAGRSGKAPFFPRGVRGGAPAHRADRFDGLLHLSAEFGAEEAEATWCLSSVVVAANASNLRPLQRRDAAGTAGVGQARVPHFTCPQAVRPASAAQASIGTAGAGVHADQHGPLCRAHGRTSSPPAGPALGFFRVRPGTDAIGAETGVEEPWVDRREGTPAPSRGLSLGCRLRARGGPPAQRTIQRGPEQTAAPPPARRAWKRPDRPQGHHKPSGQDHPPRPGGAGQTPGRVVENG